MASCKVMSNILPKLQIISKDFPLELRLAICYKMFVSGYLKFEKSAQKCLIKKPNNTTKKQELYKTCVSWIYFDMIWKQNALFLHFASSLI